MPPLSAPEQLLAGVRQSMLTMAGAMAVVLLSTASARAGDGNPAYDVHCISCHGPDREGIANQGVNLVSSRFVASQPEEALVEFLKVGRLPDDPANQTGRPMPGFSWLQESELKALAAYLKAGSGKP